MEKTADFRSSLDPKVHLAMEMLAAPEVCLYGRTGLSYHLVRCGFCSQSLCWAS